MSDAPPTRPSIPREIWVLVIAAFVVAVGYGFVAPILPGYAKGFGVSVTAASMIVSVFAFTRVIGAPPAGWIVERVGERTVYMAGLLIVAVSTAAAGLARSYGELLVFRGLGGIGSTMFTVAAMGLLVRLAPPVLRGRVSSLYGTAFLTGNILGPVLGSLMIPFGYRVPFFAYAGALLVAIAVVAVFLSGATLRVRPEAPERPAMSVGEALHDSAYRSLLGSAFANGWTNFGVRIAMLPLFAGVVPTLGEPMAGVALTVFAVGNALALQFSGRLVDGWGRKPVLQTGLLISSGATLLLGLATQSVYFLALSALAGFGAGALMPAQQAVVADVVGNERSGGTVLSVFSMVQDFGAILGPVATGLLADRVGYGWAFAVTGLMMALAAVAWIPGRETLSVLAPPRTAAPATDGGGCTS